MPSDRNTAYPFLEQMRTEELEALLQQEFTAADGGEPDVDYIIAIMEVMKQRICSKYVTVISYKFGSIIRHKSISNGA